MLEEVFVITRPVGTSQSSETHLRVFNTTSQQSSVPIEPDQSWYWTPEWQAMEAKADRDWLEGRYEVFDSVEEFLRSLDE